MMWTGWVKQCEPMENDIITHRGFRRRLGGIVWKDTNSFYLPHEDPWHKTDEETGQPRFTWKTATTMVMCVYILSVFMT